MKLKNKNTEIELKNYISTYNETFSALNMNSDLLINMDRDTIDNLILILSNYKDSLKYEYTLERKVYILKDTNDYSDSPSVYKEILSNQNKLLYVSALLDI